MDKPQIPDAPGLAWRPRKNAWAATWIASKKNYKPATRQIAVFDHEPTLAEQIDVRRACILFQEEMIGLKPPKETGTLRALINAYQTDPDSPYQNARYKSRLNFDNHARRIDRKYGTLQLADLGVRNFKRWYEDARRPDGKEGRDKVATGHGFMTAVRMMLSFGSMFEIEQCARLKAIVSDMKFENVKAREEAMTLRQCEDIIAAAHAAGLHSIALAQAMQFDLRARQKDIIGEWVPSTEPGISVIDHRHGRKWLRGLRWEEISGTMFLQHPASKTGKMIERDLTLYPMVMAELERIPAEKRSGPVVICELTGRPWKQNNFRIRWRQIATAAGIPATVYNMDSRAGGITETIEATGGNLEAARKEADHADQTMTARYSRKRRESNNDTAVIVADFRAKNKG